MTLQMGSIQCQASFRKILSAGARQKKGNRLRKRWCVSLKPFFAIWRRDFCRAADLLYLEARRFTRAAKLFLSFNAVLAVYPVVMAGHHMGVSVYRVFLFNHWGRNCSVPLD
tara:strand:+ start:11458 stop:11793 length:336 start_codon:yes stop_codon:yes gene_type:complete